MLFLMPILAIAQFEKCLVIDGNLQGIEETIYLDENDSFHSYCLCWAPSERHGTFKKQSDTSLLLTSFVNYKDLGYFNVQVDSSAPSHSAFAFRLLDSNSVPLSNEKIKLVKRNVKTVECQTDSLGFITDTTERWDYGIILNGTNSKRAYFELDSFYSSSTSTLRLTSLANIKEFNFRIIKTANSEYLIQDLRTNELLALKKCKEVYGDPNKK